MGRWEEFIDVQEKEALFPHGIFDGYTLEILDFINSIKDRSPPEVTGWDGLKALATSFAIYESDWSGRAVIIDDVLNDKVNGYQAEINEHWRL